MIFVLFVMAVTLIDLMWMFGLIRKTVPQILAVIVMFTWPFSKLATESDVPCELTVNLFHVECKTSNSQTLYPDLTVAWNEILFIRILAGFATLMSLSHLPSALPRTFSFGELCVVMQLVIPFLSISVSCIVGQYLHFDHAFCGYSNQTKVIRVIAAGLLVYVIMSKFVVSRYKARRTELLVAAFMLCAVLTYCATYRSLSTEPIRWLIRYFTRSRSRVGPGFRITEQKLNPHALQVNLMIQWAGCLLVNLVFAAVWTKTSSGTASTKIRKIFHLGISSVFVFGIKEDVELLSFCSACLLIVFVVLEVFVECSTLPSRSQTNLLKQSWRISRLWPVSTILQSCINSFKDEKDVGLLVTTPIYLLAGCALPIWMLPSGQRITLTTFSGVIAIGFGDTAASVVGSYGRIRWYKSKKTIEGTLAALIAQLFASVAIWYYVNPGQVLSATEVLVLALVSAVVALIEAKTKEIDNLVLPIYHHALMLVAKSYWKRF